MGSYFEEGGASFHAVVKNIALSTVIKYGSHQEEQFLVTATEVAHTSLTGSTAPINLLIDVAIPLQPNADGSILAPPLTVKAAPIFGFLLLVTRSTAP